MQYAIGLDIGGTKIASGIVNQKGDIIQQEIIPSDSSSRENMLQQVVLCIDTLLNHCSIPIREIHGIGVGLPGKVDRENGIAIFQNNLPWSHFPLASRLKETFGLERIVLDNDVHMAAFAEWKASEVKKEDVFVYMTISTGISCAIIHRGEFVRGAGFAGELGLIPVYAPHSENQIERLEQTASGSALETFAQKWLNNPDVTTKQLFDSFYSGDDSAKELINYASISLAQGIYTLSSLLDPQKLVVGGSVVIKNPYLLRLIKNKMGGWQVTEQTHLLNNIEISNMGMEQGIIGAGLRVFETAPDPPLVLN